VSSDPFTKLEDQLVTRHNQIVRNHRSK